MIKKSAINIIISLLLMLLLSGCLGNKSTVHPTTTRYFTQTQPTTPPQTATPSCTPLPTNTLTTTPTHIPTKTPYPIPAQVMSPQELQQRIDDWNSGKIIITDDDRFLDEKTGEPLRLGVPWPPVLDDVYFTFYNLGYTVVENTWGIPYLINIVGFEAANGERFTFPFHNGRLFSVDTPIILQEFNGRRINHGVKIFYDILTPVNFLNYYGDFINRVNIGESLIDGPDYGTETDTFGITSAEVTNDLTDFLSCDTCSLKDLPASLEKYVNQIPEKFDPALPYMFVYQVGY
jgi:hypothetical protein